MDFPTRIPRKRTHNFDDDLNSVKKSRVLRDKTNLMTPPVTPDKTRVLDFDIKQDNDKAVRALFPSPPATPTKPKSNVYSQAKALFQRGHNDKMDYCNGCLVGREPEGTMINDFFKCNILEENCNSMYISGPPGSGKTAQLDLSLSLLEKENGVVAVGDKKGKLIKLNCMVLSNARAVFRQLCNELGTSKTLYEALADGYNGYDLVVVILDEIDSLLTADQEVLFELFRLSNKKYNDKLQTKLILVGISNSLDLTEKLLPKLEKTGLHPNVVGFKPYTFDKMKAVVTAKLRSLIEVEKENIEANVVPIVNSSAILLCCKKISSTTGDLRKCFDVLYKSIELLELLLKTKLPNELPKYDLLSAPKVSIGEVAKVCNLNYNGNILTKLTYIQRIIILYLLRLEYDTIFQGKTTLNAFYDYYKKTQLSTTKLSKVRMSEFIEIISNLESLSLVTLSKNDNIGLKLVQSNVDYKEFKNSISGIDQLKHLL